jgi:predicted transglutaminase-like cysteine proteinase
VKVSKVCVILTLFFAFMAIDSVAPANARSTRENAFAPVGERTSPPIGYVEFCRKTPASCGERTNDPRDVVLTKDAWRDLRSINDQVNRAVVPETDEEQFGVPEVWSFPTTGKGDCEDYVLLKRRMLIDAGWPASALLITVVRDLKGDGHAVLMVKTDRGEFVLDNQEATIKDWRDTGYRYVKRQSQSDPSVWVSLGDTQPTATVAAP